METEDVSVVAIVRQLCVTVLEVDVLQGVELVMNKSLNSSVAGHERNRSKIETKLDRAREARVALELVMGPVKTANFRVLGIRAILLSTSILKELSRVTEALVVVTSVAMALTITTFPTITPGLESVDEAEKFSIIPTEGSAIKATTSSIIVRIFSVLLGSLTVSSAEAKIPLTTVGRITIKIEPVLSTSEITLAREGLTRASNTMTLLGAIDNLLDINVMLNVEFVLAFGTICSDVIDPSAVEAGVVAITIGVRARSAAGVCPDGLIVTLRLLATILPAIRVVNREIDILTSGGIARSGRSGGGGSTERIEQGATNAAESLTVGYTFGLSATSCKNCASREVLAVTAVIDTTAGGGGMSGLTTIGRITIAIRGTNVTKKGTTTTGKRPIVVFTITSIIAAEGTIETRIFSDLKNFLPEVREIVFATEELVIGKVSSKEQSTLIIRPGTVSGTGISDIRSLEDTARNIKDLRVVLRASQSVLVTFRTVTKNLNIPRIIETRNCVSRHGIKEDVRIEEVSEAVTET